MSTPPKQPTVKVRPGILDRHMYLNICEIHLRSLLILDLLCNIRIYIYIFFFRLLKTEFDYLIFENFSAFCPSGEEKKGGVCMQCTIGYFKDNNVDKFSECTLCPAQSITANNGSTSQSDCNIGISNII